MLNNHPEHDLVLTRAPATVMADGTFRLTRVYVAGPITGMPNLNEAAFAEATHNLRKLGYEVINPHEVEPNKGLHWTHYMRLCVAALTTCDSIYMLSHWERSRGAVWEHRIAQMLEMPCDYQFVRD